MSNTVTLGGNPVEVGGKFPAKGEQAPAFSLVGKDLADVTLASLAGKRKILNIFPSIDTPTCATSVRKFNQSANDLANTVVLCISADLPFAQGRFCGAEGLANVHDAIDHARPRLPRSLRRRHHSGPLAGVSARAVVVLDENEACCTANWSARSRTNRTTPRPSPPSASRRPA